MDYDGFTMTETVAAAAPPFPKDVCANCGYSLLGLPNECICPECGKTIDQSEIVLYGNACGKHETAMNARASRLPWVILSSVVVSVLYLWTYVISSFFHNTKGLLAMGLVLLPPLYLLLRRRQIEHPGLVQIRIGPHGCVQLDDLSGPSIIRDNFLRMAGSFSFQCSFRSSLNGD